MRLLLIKAEYLLKSTTYIGKVGENNATQVKIDTTVWIDRFQDIDFEAIYKRADGVLYPVDIKQDGNYITWDVARKDLYKSGTAYLTIIGYKNNHKVLSTKSICLIMPGLNGITIDSDYEDDPTPTKWIQDVVDEIKDYNNTVDKKIETIVQSVGHLKRLVVEELPNVYEADLDTIYMIKKLDSDSYIEYIIIEENDNRRFEKIGDTDIDLSNYVTKITPEANGNIVGITLDGSLVDGKITPNKIIEHINNNSIHPTEKELNKLKNLSNIKGIGNGLSLDEDTGEIYLKINSDLSNGLLVTKNGLTIKNASSLSSGAMTSELFNKLAQIEDRAQVNKIEQILIDNSPLLINNKTVVIPLAGLTPGLVKSSTDDNTIYVDSSTGVMSVNRVSISKIYIPEGEIVVIDAGDSNV